MARTRFAAALVIAGVGMGAPTARAEPWYRGRLGRIRVEHLSIAVAGGLAYAASETFLKSDLAPDACRWCAPPSFDRTIRDRVVWSNTGDARLLSNLDGYLIAPVVGLGLLSLGTFAGDASWARTLDDAVPVLETVALSQVVVQAVKFSVGRARPFVYFGDPSRAHELDDDVSFFSAHSTLTFSIAASAGLIAHWRHYAAEPYIWGAGMLLAASTAYLRLAADEHYFSDVVVGSAAGVVAGLTIPYLMRHDERITVVPTASGIGLAGRF